MLLKRFLKVLRFRKMCHTLLKGDVQKICWRHFFTQIAIRNKTSLICMNSRVKMHFALKYCPSVRIS